jgi:hypothetical protein
MTDKRTSTRHRRDLRTALASVSFTHCYHTDELRAATDLPSVIELYADDLCSAVEFHADDEL